MRTDNKIGFTLTELMAGIVIGGIVILMISAIGSIVYQSYNNMRNQVSVYNDSQFALQLIREGVRESTAIPTYSSGCLTITTAAGANYYYTVTSGSTKSLVYSTQSCIGPTYKSIISGVTNYVFTPNVNSLPLVSVLLRGTESGVSFNYSIYATRRI